MEHVISTVYTVLTTCLNYFYLCHLSVTKSCPTLCDRPHELHTRFSCPSLSQICLLLKLMSIESVMPSNHLSSVAHFCPQSFPASGSFPLSWLFASGGQSIGASASVLPVNVQGWLPLELTGLISLLSMGLSRVLSSATVSINSLALSFLYGPTLKSICDYRWKTMAKWCLCFLIC